MGKGITITIDNRIREELVKMAVEITNETVGSVYADVVELTPVGQSKRNYTGSRLRKGWGITPASIHNRMVVGYLYNNVHYTGHVNYGHRTRLGLGKKAYTKLHKSKGLRKKRVVKGQWFLQEALRRNGFNMRRVGGY